MLVSSFAIRLRSTRVPVKNFEPLLSDKNATKDVQQLEKALGDDAIVKSSTEDCPKLPAMIFFDSLAEDW